MTLFTLWNRSNAKFAYLFMDVKWVALGDIKIVIFVCLQVNVVATYFMTFLDLNQRLPFSNNNCIQVAIFNPCLSICGFDYPRPVKWV